MFLTDVTIVHAKPPKVVAIQRNKVTSPLAYFPLPLYPVMSIETQPAASNARDAILYYFLP